MTLVDAHVHLTAYGDAGGALQLAAARSMSLVSCTVNAAEATESFRIRSMRPQNVRCFVGVHPSDATAEAPSAKLAPYLDQCDGIGEIGLDQKYPSASEGTSQTDAFLDQLRVAERLGKPVQVHSRGSELRCLEILSTFSLKTVLMHWFEGEALLREVVSRGYFVSVGPAVLYSKRIRRISRAIPAEKILTESDGPVTYGPLGGLSGPSLIASVLFGVAGARSEEYNDLERQVENNAKRFLGVERLI